LKKLFQPAPDSVVLVATPRISRNPSALEIDGTNLVGLLNELKAEDLIERRRSPEDRRPHVVSLTDAGAKRLADAERALESVEDEVLGALDDSQREVLNNLLLQAARGGEASKARAATSATLKLEDAAGYLHSCLPPPNTSSYP
jgi:DNA-binding PadR family transcriptional regulator